MTVNIDRKPLVLIGLDGGDWSLLAPWFDKGRLPNLEALREQGSYGDMISTIPPLTGPALASFFTGRNPDNTGITGFINRKGELISYNDIAEGTIWDYLSAADIPSCIVGLRLTYPPKKIHGVMLSGGLLRNQGNDFVQPVDLQEKVAGFHPDPATYPEMERVLVKGRVKDSDAFTNELIALTQKQFAVFDCLRSQERYPFSLLWIENTDLLQHFCWREKDKILRLYECIDALIGQFMKKNPDVNLMLISDHGFNVVPDVCFHVNTWLHENGFLEKEKPSPGKFATRFLKKALSRAARTLSLHQKRRIRLFYGKLSGKLDIRPPDRPIVPPLAAAAAKNGFDPSRTTAYAGVPWGIRLNAELTAEPEQVIGRLIDSMQSSVDPEGGKVFKFICRKSEIYSGKYFDEMPDVLFLANERYQPELDVTDKIFKPVKRPQRVTGVHDQARHGIMIAHGPDLDKTVLGGSIRIIDFMPTILGYFGLQPQAAVDGENRRGLFRVPGPGSDMVNVTLAGAGGETATPYSDQDAEAIRKRLEKMGYL